MDITEMPFNGSVHKAYTLAIISLLDLLHPELDILEITSRIAESIYEKVILREGGLGGTENDNGETGGGSRPPQDSDGTQENH